MRGLQRVDRLTVAGLGALLMPVLTMWHEIGGHVAACAVQGGHVATIGAFYVECQGLPRLGETVVACAGVVMNAALALLTYLGWRRARVDGARLVLWLIWVSQALVAAGYFCFSGAVGAGDLGTGPLGALAWLPAPLAWRAGEFVFGVAAYVTLVRAAIRGLNAMLGTGGDTRAVRRTIAHTYYAVAGLGAVLVGLLNPVGLGVTLLSAAASSFGGLAGFISIGFAARGPDAPRPFQVGRSWPLLIVGVLALATFALILGPSLHP